MTTPKASMTRTAIIPFGKYKGQPLEVLTQDQEYLDWLTGQDWFRSRYQNLYAIVINNFQAPSDTPEHNLLQAKFLDDRYRHKIAYFLSTGKRRDSLDFETDMDPEVDGMDVLINSSHDCFRRAVDIYVEIKPQVGDDYPAILRQIRSSGAYKNQGSGNQAVKCVIRGKPTSDSGGCRPLIPTQAVH